MKRTLIAALGATGAGLLLASPAFADDRGWGMHRDNDGHPIVMMIIFVVLLAVAGSLVAWALTRDRAAKAAAPAPAPYAAASPTAAAEAILAERLARGEVSPDDYRTLLATLRGGPAT